MVGSPGAELAVCVVRTYGWSDRPRSQIESINIVNIWTCSRCSYQRWLWWTYNYSILFIWSSHKRNMYQRPLTRRWWSIRLFFNVVVVAVVQHAGSLFMCTCVSGWELRSPTPPSATQHRNHQYYCYQLITL